VKSILVATVVLALLATSVSPALADIASAATSVRPLLIGQTAPDVELRRPSGEAVSLAGLLDGAKTVLIFYRGGWCPYCSAQLDQLQALEAKLLEKKFRIIALSADSPENVAKSAGERKLTYTLLSDNEMKAAAAFGVAYRLDDPSAQRLKAHGLDVEAASGRTHHVLPVPAVFIIDPERAIRFVHVDPNYRRRLDPAVLEAVVNSMD
jgi:peroxiredoxin